MGNTKWFQDARFGLFIHGGLYSIPAKDEWYASIPKSLQRAMRNILQNLIQ